ncbi:TPA: DUF645 family protein, partial [Vibrio cholerae]|nr:DUF645 family protein [Vibrio cholerae]HDZ3764150.1 DUF645 family protein [Vibrio cholerae]
MFAVIWFSLSRILN